MKKPVSVATVARLAAVVLFFAAAPTAGDIGSCGQPPDDLDPVKYFTAKEALDCQKCRDCQLFTNACVRACEPALDQAEFPRDCYPLVHDGEVCLHVLQVTGCGEYRQFMSDTSPTIPTECNFCPPCNDGGAPDASPDGSPVLPGCD